MAKKKRRKVPREQRLRVPKTRAGEWATVTFNSPMYGVRQKTVRMRCLPGGPDSHHWQAYIDGAWFTRTCLYLPPGSAKRAGNNWAKRRGYTPKWE